MTAREALSPKAAATREAIAETAIRLFRERGYERTTMRAVAEEAGVSLGNAYYYFGSKEHLIQAFYDQVQVDHEAAAAPVLARERSFAARLRGVLEAWVDVAEPSHAFADQFFKNAAEPSSPLSPFSEQSRAAREAATELFRRTVEGADLRVSSPLREELPELLWLAHMGMVLFWVHDRSPGQARTRALIGQAVPLIDKVIRLTRLPGVRGVVQDVVELVHTLRGPGTG